MKILIVGSDLNSLLLAKYIKVRSIVHDVYITLDESDKEDYYTPVGIRENDIEGIYDFVKYNKIDFTIVFSRLAIINGIADVFEKDNLAIAAPYSEAARVTFFNSIAKKVMYKLKIPTVRFGIFDRENIASEYIRQAKFPIVIMNDFTLNERNNVVYYGYKKARLALQKIFENTNEKIVIENHIDTEAIYLYFLTDGYNVLPLISMKREEKENFTEITAPSGKITRKMTNEIMKKAIYPLLDDISKYAGNYSGIIGVKIKIKGNNFYVLEYYNGFENYDFQAFLSLLDEDLVNLFKDSTQRRLKFRNSVRLENKFSYTIVIKKEGIKNIIDEEDYFISEDDENVIITKTASTLNFAKKEIAENLK